MPRNSQIRRRLIDVRGRMLTTYAEPLADAFTRNYRRTVARVAVPSAGERRRFSIDTDAPPPRSRGGFNTDNGHAIA